MRRAVLSAPEQHRAPASEGGGRGQHAIVGFTPGSRTIALGLPEATITDTRPTPARKTTPQAACRKVSSSHPFVVDVCQTHPKLTADGIDRASVSLTAPSSVFSGPGPCSDSRYASTAYHGRPPAQNGDASQVDTQVFTDLSTAIHAREELRFDYAQDRKAATEQQRRVQPHHLAPWRGRWYLLAWDLDRDDWRTFRVDRIHPRTPTGPRFTPRELPGGDVPAFVASRFRGSDGTTTDWPCQGEVVLHLPATAVAPFAQDGIVEELGPDRCRLALGSWSWTGLAATIGRFDADVEVIGPPELNDAFARLATRYANAARTTTPC